ncbi:hypothetical protein XENTR_v10012832 [Xenopus tropicalis]|uniref:Uncharacterized LOC116410474 n=1 Tax=Xenopus tropicalis TaxID=8364 RepID=A0A803K749_XENTR|nr:uncharacterized protein LOC116410474 [Xenopus tropicalis]KAE8612367.1 hypothetical protein XENTR_v10012832 [Xenopus tropicalis]
MAKLFVIVIFIGILAKGGAQRRFLTAFMDMKHWTPSTKLELYLVTYDKPATVAVTVAEPLFNKTVAIESDSYGLVTLDYQYMISESEKKASSKMVLVTSSEDISVFAFYIDGETSDAMACLPQEDLGMEYYIFTPGGRQGNQFAIANGLEEVVSVSVTVSGLIEFNGIQYRDRDSFSFSLESQQIIQFQSQYDITGTGITASAPVAVFSGNKCFAGIGVACDIVVDQLYPVKNWGEHFAAFPLLKHHQDFIDIIAANANTVVNVDEANATTEYILHQGSHVRLTLSDAILVDSSKPVMMSYVLQDSKPNGYVDRYDPFFTSVPSLEPTRKYYKFITHGFYFNFLLIVSNASSVSEFYLDHQPLSQYNVSTLELHGVNGFEVALGKVGGQHEIYHESSTFTIYVYGIEAYRSYGYPLGQETTYPDPPSPKPTLEPESSPLLQCSTNGAEYHLPMKVLYEAGLSVNDIHLEDPLCQAEQDGNFAVIKVPLSGCGTSILNKEGQIVYINTVYGTVPRTSIHRIEAPVSCEMKREENLRLNFNPKVTDVVSRGHYNISLKFYHSDAFAAPITDFPYEMSLPSKLYVEFKVESVDKELQLLTEDCKCSPSLEDTGNSYTLIQHGCFQDFTLQEHPVLDHREQRFSFHAFKFDKSEEVFVACRVIICHNSTYPNRCTQGCAGHRHKRDVFGSKVHMDWARLSQGPVVFTHGGTPNLSDRTFFSSVFVATLCVLGLLCVVALRLQRHHYYRQGYSLVQCDRD